MKPKQLYKLAKEIWYPELRVLRFNEKNGEYIRHLNSGVAHLIGIGKDPHGAESFRVMCGVSAIAINEETGSFGYAKYDGLTHITRSGWDYNSGRWSCEDEDKARASLVLVLSLIQELAIPYLDRVAILTDVANEYNVIRKPGLGWMKARLYQLDGNFACARAAIDDYAAWAAKPRNWGTKEDQQEDVDRAVRLLQEVDIAEAEGS